MQMAIVVAGAAILASALSIQAAAAQTESSMKEQVTAQCPAAAAWFSTPHDGLTVKQRAALKSIKPSDPALAKQLAERYNRDQAVAEAVIKAGVASEPTAEAMKSPAAKRMIAVHKADLAWFKPIFDTHGFPTIQEVGRHGIQHAWMIVQHAEMDRKFQAQVLASLKPRLASEPYLRSDYALLLDRVRVQNKEPQVYGTQFTTKRGQLVMQRTEDPRNLDSRRAGMSLMPISDYRCFLHVMYQIPSKPSAVKSAARAK